MIKRAALSIDFDRRVIHLIAFVLLAALSIEPVKAAILPAEATSITVRFHSGDLDTLPGVAGLYRRIRAAARSACGQPDDAFLLDKVIWEQCVDRAIAEAVGRVHSGSLSAYWGLHGRKGRLLEAPEAVAERGPAAAR